MEWILLTKYEEKKNCMKILLVTILADCSVKDPHESEYDPSFPLTLIVF